MIHPQSRNRLCCAEFPAGENTGSTTAISAFCGHTVRFSRKHPKSGPDSRASAKNSGVRRGARSLLSPVTNTFPVPQILPIGEWEDPDKLFERLETAMKEGYEFGLCFHYISALSVDQLVYLYNKTRIFTSSIFAKDVQRIMNLNPGLEPVFEPKIGANGEGYMDYSESKFIFSSENISKTHDICNALLKKMRACGILFNACASELRTRSYEMKDHFEHDYNGFICKLLQHAFPPVY